MNKKALIVSGPGETVSDLRYVSHLSTPDDFIFFASGRQLRGVVVSDLEYGRAVRSCPEDFTIINSGEFDRGPIERQLIGLAARFGFTEFSVPEYFPVGAADELRASGITVHAVRGAFFPEREFKSADELEAIRRPLRAAESALRLARETIADAVIGGDGVLIAPDGETLTSEKLRFIIHAELLRHQCSGVGTIASSGKQSALPHHAGSGPIRAGTPIVMDIFPRDENTGYWGDLTRTVVRGKAPEHVRKAFDRVRRVRDLAQERIRAGAVPSELHRFAEQEFEAGRFFTGRDENGPHGFFHSLGHGVGLDIHEAPRLGPNNDRPLRGGEVVTVEPGLYYPEWGGIRMENMVFVKEGGFELLTEIDDVFEL